MKLAIDFGNRNFKLIYKKGDKLKFDLIQSRFTTEKQLDYSNCEYIKLNDTVYVLEQGDYDFEFDKTNKVYLPFLLAAICRATDLDKIEVELMIGAPAEMVLGKRQTFKEQLEGKTFEFEYNSTKKCIRIERIGVIAEGFSTYFALSNEARNKKNIGIVDIGGRTVNIVTFINGKQDKVFTLNKGMLDIKTDLLKIEKAKGKDYDINNIENMLDNNIIQISNNVKEAFVNNIINVAKSYKIDIDLYNWHCVGGGSIDFGSEILEKYFGKSCVAENALYSNVLGYYNFMVAKWGV